MRLPTEENNNGPTQTVVPVDLDNLIEKLKENLTMKSCCREKVDRRHNARSSPYCVPRRTVSASNKTLISHGAAEHQYDSQGLIKCSKCFQRQCRCSYAEDNTSTNSIRILKELLREQTLIQEAVRRLQSRSDEGGERVFDRPCSPVGDAENDWHSEGFTTRHTSYESEVETPSESDIDS